MPISQTDALFQLIKSLTKGEKRNFRSYAKRNQTNDSLKFIDLFDTIDKQSECMDDFYYTKLKLKNKTQYSNLKRHLYSQIVASLRLIHKAKRANIQVREYIDFAYILYGKGLYLQALKILGKARRDAVKHHLNYMHLTIVEFEKMIENRHITRSGGQRAIELAKEAGAINKTISNTIYLSNLRLEYHGKYIKNGHVQNEEDRQIIKGEFLSKLKGIDELELGVMEKCYYYLSYVWYSYIQLDFQACLDYSIKWVELFTDNPEMIRRDVDLFMRGYHYIIISAFHLKDVNQLNKYLESLEHFRKSEYGKLNDNSKIISFLYVHTGRLNKVIMNGDFANGLKVIPKTLRRIKRYGDKVDDHRILVFYFKIAWIYFGAKKIDKAMFYLNKIVNKDLVNLREDLQLYARLLVLMCHYDSGEMDSVSISLKKFKSYFKSSQNLSTSQSLAIDLFKKLAQTPLYDHSEMMKTYFKDLEVLKEDSFQQVSLSYLDVSSWLKAKIERKSLGEVVKNSQE